jgi:tetratricopeptide (TPR) repeat protein
MTAEKNPNQPTMQRATNLFAQQRFQEALNDAQHLLAEQKENTDLLHLAGASAFMLGLAAQAEAYWKQALEAKPDFYQSWFSLGFLFTKQAKFEQAEACYKKVVELYPNYGEAYCNLGSLYVDMERMREAELCYRKALEIDPESPSAHANIGIFYMRQKKTAQAEQHLRKNLALRPDYDIANNNYGRLCFDLMRYDEAEQYYRKALALNPANADTYFNYANLLVATRRYDQAEAGFRKVIALNPNYSDAYGNCGNLLKDRGRLEEAEQMYLRVLPFRPADAEVFGTLGALYIKLKQFKQAEDYFRKALEIDPSHVKSLLNFSFLLLSQERYEEGWLMYEARYRFDPKTNQPALCLPNLPFPQWHGEALTGKSIAILHEQGFGDMIQFARYAALLKKQCGARHITLVAKLPLITLMRTLDGVDALARFEEQDRLPPHDYWTYALSIPLHVKTRRDSVPVAMNYFSVSEEARKKWRGRLPFPELKVGLVWKGSTDHVDDGERSLPHLETLRPLWQTRGVLFVSLQKGQGGEEAARPPPDLPLLDLGAKIEDFADTAAIIEQLDLVITVDTAIAHLAGALGKPVWILMRHAADWRWGNAGEKSVWYPSLLILRQERRGQWGAVVERARGGLVSATEHYWARAVKAKPGDAAAHFYLAAILQDSARLAEAEPLFLRAAILMPDNPNIHGQMGNLYKEMGREQEAEACYKKALTLQPDSFAALNNLASLQKAQKRYPEAIASYQRALASKPDFVDAHNNLGNLYLVLDRFDDAEKCYRKAITLSPGFIEGYNNLGLLFKEKGRWTESEQCYRKSLSIQPENPKTRFLLSLLLLTQGRFEEGWFFFETPYRYDQNIDKPVQITPFQPWPVWHGERLEGKTLLIWYEQGFGDVIQFARYAAILKKQGAARIDLMCKKPLKALMQTLEGIDRVLCYEEDTDFGPYDFWTFVMSIPLYCKTRLDTIPPVMGYLSAPKDSRQKWRKRLPAVGKKVGLVWKGSTDHKRDHERSLAHLDVLKPLWKAKGINFISLQKGQGQDEAAQPPKGQPIIDLAPEIENFADVAAIVEQLDLVICVDTAVAHLAGALGKPVWVMLPQIADWRWLMEREDSPWYPTVRLFRQTKRNDWEDVIERVALELAKG